jgi:hypothetical protein
VLITIKHPKYKTEEALIAVYKIKNSDELYTIVFTDTTDKRYKGKGYQMLGKEIIKYPKQTNGTIDCFYVPLKDMKEVG